MIWRVWLGSWFLELGFRNREGAEIKHGQHAPLHTHHTKHCAGSLRQRSRFSPTYDRRNLVCKNTKLQRTGSRKL